MSEVMSAMAVALALMLMMSWSIAFTLTRRAGKPHVQEKLLRPALCIGAIIVVIMAAAAAMLRR